MNQQEVMQQVKALAEQISQSHQPSNTLDIAWLKAKCVALYEQVQQLEPLLVAPVSEIRPDELVPLIEAQIQYPPTSLPSESIPVITSIKEVQIETVLTTQQDEINQMVEPPVIEEKPVQTLFESTNASVKEDISLHEYISKSSPKNDLNDRLQAKVESLKSAISLNKKIAFVNQLFRENTVEYAKAIDRLNAATQLEEALLYLSELKHNYNWDNENELVRDLQSLVEKRFNA